MDNNQALMLINSLAAINKTLQEIQSELNQIKHRIK